MPCKYGKTLTDFSKYISKEILQCEQIKELLMAKKEVDVGPLIVSFYLKMVLNLLELIQELGTRFLLSPKVLCFLQQAGANPLLIKITAGFLPLTSMRVELHAGWLCHLALGWILATSRCSSIYNTAYLIYQISGHF